MTTAVLSARECSFSYGPDQFALTGVSLDVSAGEVLGIVGPNGSGKSTLLRLMGGFLRPDEGEVLLGERPLRTVGRRELATDLAFLPQTARTAFGFSAREVVSMGRYPYQGAFGFLREPDIRVVEQAMVETATTGLAARSFSTLSGGERQRVLIASVLAQEPSVMLLDEPTAALDIHHQVDVLDLLWSLSRGGLAVVIVTHDLNAAGQFCDRLALLSGGRMVRVGPPADVMDADLLSETYAADVHVMQHPLTGKPLVLVLGEGAHAAH